MLTEVSDVVLEALRAMDRFQQLGEWAGEVEDLLKSPHKLPAAFLIYGGCGFGEGPVAIGTAVASAAQVWTVVLLSKNLRSRGDGALEAYAHLEAIRAPAAEGGLRRLAVPGGWLWPKREGLVSAKGGVLVYGIDFTLEGEV